MFALLIALTLPADPTTYYVETGGVDAAEQDGLSRETAFRTLAYAAERTTGESVIRLGRGRHVCTRPAVLKSNTEVLGQPFHGKPDGWAILVADVENWERPLVDEKSGLFCEGAMHERALVSGKTIENVRFWGVKFQGSESDRNEDDDRPRLVAGAHFRDCEGLEIDGCRFADFKWAGVYAYVCRDIAIKGCGFARCSTDRCRHRGGQIYTRYVRNIEVANCRLAPSRNSGGYGYKGGGHDGAHFHDNTFETAYFAIEIPHENEAGVEINNNVLKGAVSIPKGGDASPPQRRGHDYSFNIHHNVMTDSYGIEGPRNYLWVHHNYVRIEKPNGRFYAQFGGYTEGPIWIEHNIFENVDRALVWQREGRTGNLFFRNNTVVLADTITRNERLFGAWAGDRIDNWNIEDNIFVSPYSASRTLTRHERGVDEKIRFAGNIFVGMADAPAGSRTIDPQLRRGDAEKPLGYYAPANDDGPTVDTGTRVPFEPRASRPDVGAIEPGVEFGVIGPRR